MFLTRSYFTSIRLVGGVTLGLKTRENFEIDRSYFLKANFWPKEFTLGFKPKIHKKK